MTAFAAPSPTTGPSKAEATGTTLKASMLLPSPASVGM